MKKELLEKLTIELKTRKLREIDSVCWCKKEYERAWIDALNWVKRVSKK